MLGGLFPELTKRALAWTSTRKSSALPRALKAPVFFRCSCLTLFCPCRLFSYAYPELDRTTLPKDEDDVSFSTLFSYLGQILPQSGYLVNM